ncbi:MAG TPA: DNA cytosine methyltransferase, partial [Anaeromyxobacteraceae bacterium]|nr:DNA cytosine methyltransferase [Anaeromyxobacteraceae bacterium]
MITIGSLFSGIGGLELGLERAGLGPVLWQVEKDARCREVLAKHWPGVEQHEDVCTVDARKL